VQHITTSRGKGEQAGGLAGKRTQFWTEKRNFSPVQLLCIRRRRPGRVVFGIRNEKAPLEKARVQQNVTLSLTSRTHNLGGFTCTSWEGEGGGGTYQNGQRLPKLADGHDEVPHADHECDDSARFQVRLWRRWRHSNHGISVKNTNHPRQQPIG